MAASSKSYMREFRGRWFLRAALSGRAPQGGGSAGGTEGTAASGVPVLLQDIYNSRAFRARNSAAELRKQKQKRSKGNFRWTGVLHKTLNPRNPVNPISAINPIDPISTKP